MDCSIEDVNFVSLINSCKPMKKRGRPSHKRQLQEIRDERRLNLQTADSVVVATNLKSILTYQSLQSLPTHCQTLLARLLPKFDQVVNENNGLVEASPTALNNEHFARFCSQFQEKLSDNKLCDDAVEQTKTDTSRELARLDPWKLRNYEPIWGQKLVSQILDDNEEEDELCMPRSPKTTKYK